MKVRFKYYEFQGGIYQTCGVYESDNEENDGVITDYLSTLNWLSWMSEVLEKLRDPTITRDWISSQAFDALIEHDQIKVGFYLLDDMEEEDIPDDVDERDTDPRFIPVKNLPIYWKNGSLFTKDLLLIWITKKLSILRTHIDNQFEKTSSVLLCLIFN